MTTEDPVRDNTAEHRFELAIDGEDEVAAAYYRLDGDRIVLTHTIVPEKFSGRGADRDWRAASSTPSARAVARQCCSVRSWPPSTTAIPTVRTSSTMRPAPEAPHD